MDGLVLHVRQIDRGHLPVPVSDRKRDVNMLKRRHLSAHEPRAELYMPVHFGASPDPFNQDSENRGIEADPLVAYPVTVITSKRIHQNTCVCVIDDADMRDGFPALRGHIGDDLAGNVKVFCHGSLPYFA